jgi:DNA polymerase I-like protein with 3'-5' exonuclease and polymerase domains
VLVGVDASGLELRCLAHYLSTYDNGKYISILLEGDIHSANQKAVGLKTRDQAKTFIYAFIYGASAPRIGAIIGGGAREGTRLINRFLSKLPALKHLKDKIETALENRDHLVGLDGRKIPIRSNHSALNALLQSAGAVLMKQATVTAFSSFVEEGLDVKQVAHIHDEIQYEVSAEDSERVGELAVKAIQNAGKPFGFRCPLDGEYKIGECWRDTH